MENRSLQGEKSIQKLALSDEQVVDFYSQVLGTKMIYKEEAVVVDRALMEMFEKYRLFRVKIAERALSAFLSIMFSKLGLSHPSYASKSSLDMFVRTPVNQYPIAGRIIQCKSDNVVKAIETHFNNGNFVLGMNQYEDIESFICFSAPNKLSVFHKDTTSALLANQGVSSLNHIAQVIWGDADVPKDLSDWLFEKADAYTESAT